MDRGRKIILAVTAVVVGLVVVVAAVSWGSHMEAVAAQQRVELQHLAAQQTAAAVRQTVMAQQSATLVAQQTVQAEARQTVVAVNAEVQQTAAAKQTAIVVAQQAEVGIRAAAQETAVAAEAQDTAVAQQPATAAVQQTVVAQQTADAVAQQAAVAEQTAEAPHDQPLGYWNHKCVVQSINSDETVTYTSDGTWANTICSAVLSRSNSQYVSFPANAARPGYIQCAFIHLYGSGIWREFSNYSNPPSGGAQVAVRSTDWADASTDCSSFEHWIAQQNAARGN